MLLPRALRPGGLIAVIAPASRAKRLGLNRGVKTLKRFGYRVKLYCAPGLTDGYLAGPDATRARLLHAAFADRSVDAILCERGGYGTLRLLDRLDFGLIKRNPKVFVGYSDLTILQWAIRRHAGLVTFYGPMIAFHNPSFAWRHLWRALSHSGPLGRVPVPPPFRPRALKPGRAEGPILGGTLSLISKLIGTPYLPDLRGAILFLEDVGEKPHKLDGYLAHLRLAGIFKQVKGVILANFKNCAPQGPYALPLERIFRDHLRDFTGPVVLDYPFGHRDPMFTLPQGVRARLDARTGVELLGAAVR